MPSPLERKSHPPRARPLRNRGTARGVLRGAQLSCGAVLLLLLAACATTPRPASIDETSLRVRIANDSRDRVSIYLARDASTPERIGAVPALTTRTFILPLSVVEHARLRLLSVSVPTGPTELGTHATVPFRLYGAREVDWVIETDRRLSVVTLGVRHP
jgi:hypothetical protein